MIHAYVFYNQNVQAITPKHGDYLRMVPQTIEFEDRFTKDEDICEQVFAGMNTGSGREFPFFKNDTKLRCMRSGDVVTIIRAGGVKRSYSCEISGWKELPTIVCSSGCYSNPLREPVIWTDNKTFMSDADDLVRSIEHIQLVARTVSSMTTAFCTPYNAEVANSWSKQLQAMTQNLLNKHGNGATPQQLKNQLIVAEATLSPGTDHENIVVFLDYLDVAKEKIKFCMDFTHGRMSEHNEKVRLFNEQRQAAPSTTPVAIAG